RHHQPGDRPRVCHSSSRPRVRDRRSFMGRHALAVVFLVACAQQDDGLVIAGSYTDPFGTNHVITDTSWDQSSEGYASTYAIASYDNDAQFLIAENDANNGYNASLWSRFDWVEHDGVLYYCQTTFDAASEDDANAVERGEDTDPTTGGCQ